MNTLILMALMALLLSAGFVAGYLWALSNGQYEDLDTPARRILKNDEPTPITTEGKLHAAESEN